MFYSENLKTVARWWEWTKLALIILIISVLSGVWVMCAHAQHAPQQFYHNPYVETPQQQRWSNFWNDQNERWWIDHERQQYEADQIMRDGEMELREMEMQNQIDAMKRQLERMSE